MNEFIEERIRLVRQLIDRADPLGIPSRTVREIQSQLLLPASNGK
jgi:hypothetical protein